MNEQIRQAEESREVSARYKSRIQWRDRLAEEKSNWDDIEIPISQIKTRGKHHQQNGFCEK